MQVAKYWRNNNLRYRMDGVVQNKVERTVKTEPVQLSERQTQIKHTKISKAEVA